MSNYTPLTNFGAKDTLPSGNAAKVVRGSEFTIEFNNIASSIATKAEVNAPSFTSNATFGGNIVVSGTVDGRDLSTDGGKLDLIESLATADQTDAEIKTAYENNSNTNAFTDADQSKLNAIEASADVTDTANVTTAGAAMLTGASFTGNVSTTGTLATGGFTLPATDGTAGQALLTNGSGAVAWSDVTVDITGKANLSGAVFTGGVSIGSLPSNPENLSVTGVTTLYNGANVTGNISLDSNAVYLSNLNDVGGKGRIGIGTNTPTASLDIVAENGATIRLSSDNDKTNQIVFQDNDSENINVMIKAYNESNHNGTDAGFLKLEAREANGLRNVFEMRPNFTHSNRPIHSGLNIVGDNVFSLVGSTHANFIASNLSGNARAGIAAVLDKNTTYGGGSTYFDGIIATGLIDATNGYAKKGSIRADGEGAIALYAAHQNKGVKYQDEVFEPCATTDVSNGLGGTLTRYLQGALQGIDLGRSANRWDNIYLANQPNVSSDQRLKQNIEDADDAGSTIDAIQVRKFDWIEGGKHQSYGMIAQELAEVYPEAVSVSENDEDTLGIATGDLIPMLIKEVQSLRSRVAELENV